jgi:hypothetical protein
MFFLCLYVYVYTALYSYISSIYIYRERETETFPIPPYWDFPISSNCFLKSGEGMELGLLFQRKTRAAALRKNRGLKTVRKGNMVMNKWIFMDFPELFLGDKPTLKSYCVCRLIFRHSHEKALAVLNVLTSCSCACAAGSLWHWVWDLPWNHILPAKKQSLFSGISKSFEGFSFNSHVWWRKTWTIQSIWLSETSVFPAIIYNLNHGCRMLLLIRGAYVFPLLVGKQCPVLVCHMVLSKRPADRSSLSV